MACTWRLWTPQTQFPRIPLLEGMAELGPWADWLGCVCLVAAAGFLAAGRKTPVAFGGYALSMLWMVLLDQHRLQPWAYHFMLMSALGAYQERGAVRQAYRGLLVSIYLFSALSKFDHQFLHTLGQQFLDALFLHLPPDGLDLSDQVRVPLAGGFPLAELVVGLGLCWSKSRRYAAYLALLLHASLLVVLGPLGLQHHPGVLVWNLFFIVQVVCLYLRPATSSSSDALAFAVAPRWWKVSIWVLVLLPLAESMGWLDHWPAWQLYAPRNSRASVYLLPNAADKLPVSMESFLEPADAAGLYQRLDMDAWSLQALNAPNYPQDRFQLGVAAAVARDYDLAGAIQVVRQGVASRVSGKRASKTLRGTEQLHRELDTFRLNARPR